MADLVLLRADPLADIHNTTLIQGVWLQGKYFDQAALAGMLEAAKQGGKALRPERCPRPRPSSLMA
jgi:hypothetical protein